MGGASAGTAAPELATCKQHIRVHGDEMETVEIGPVDVSKHISTLWPAIKELSIHFTGLGLGDVQLLDGSGPESCRLDTWQPISVLSGNAVYVKMLRRGSAAVTAYRYRYGGPAAARGELFCRWSSLHVSSVMGMHASHHGLRVLRPNRCSPLPRLHPSRSSSACTDTGTGTGT